jgi:hypothetical protein
MENPPPPPPATAFAPPEPPPVHPRCWKCGYELSGIRVDGKCPECGTDIWSRPPTSQVNGMATTAMVLGIVSIALCVACLGPLSIVIAIPAVVCGHMARNQAKSLPGPNNGSGAATAGIILGWVTIGLSVVLVGLYIVLIAAGSFI